LTRCVVLLLDVTRALRIDRCVDCAILCGPSAGSVLLHNCTGCVFMLAAHQIRIHDSNQCTYYLHVRTQPIIEGCTAVSFAPYGLTYAGAGDAIAAAGLWPLPSSLQWRAVNDFKWLATGVASPHWRVLPVADRAVDLVAAIPPAAVAAVATSLPSPLPFGAAISWSSPWAAAALAAEAAAAALPVAAVPTPVPSVPLAADVRTVAPAAAPLATSSDVSNAAVEAVAAAATTAPAAPPPAAAAAPPPEPHAPLPAQHALPAALVPLSSVASMGTALAGGAAAHAPAAAVTAGASSVTIVLPAAHGGARVEADDDAL